MAAKYLAGSDLIHRFGQAEINRLGGDDQDRIDAALADAESEIDAALASTYDLPLTGGPWPVLSHIASDLARQRLYDDKAPEAVTERADRSRELLGRIADQSAILLDAAGSTVPVSKRAAASRTGPDPVLTQENLEAL